MRLLIESVNAEQNEQITSFYRFVREKLNITDNPILTFVPSLHTTSFGVYSPSQDSVTVATDGRHISDILRTLGHELVHHKQITTGSEATLEELEYEANAVAGMLMRDYNKLHPEMFGLDRPVPTPPGTIADVGASHMGQDFPQTPTYESGLADGQPMRPPYPIEMGEEVLSELSNKTMASYKRKAKAELRQVAGGSSWHKYFMKQYFRNHDLKATREHGIHRATEKLKKRYMKEEGGVAVGGAPINSAGAGNVAGIGIGPQGEPGIHPKKKKTPMFQRKTLAQLKEELIGR